MMREYHVRFCERLGVKFPRPTHQYFLGFHEFRDEAPFDPSMYVHFRKRFSLDQLGRINEAIATAEQAGTQEEKAGTQEEKAGTQEEKASGSDDDDDNNTPSDGHRGQLLIDATCAPADIRYPTDISLVNEAREKSEQIIDTLFNPLKGSCAKPRTYRQKARRQFLSYAKTRKPSSRRRRKAWGQQLRFLARNLTTIGQLAQQTSLTTLDRRQYRTLLVVQELYRQQQWMFENRCHRISGRIVSLSQPHIRPIVRGKASTPVEFGAKLSASVVDGAVFLDRLD